MDLNLPGGDEALKKVFERHPSLAVAQSVLVVASIAANLALFPVLRSKPGLLTAYRVPRAPWSFGRGIEMMARYGFIFFGVMILALMLKQEFGASLSKAGVGDLHLTAIATGLVQVLSLGLVALFWRQQKRENGAAVGAYWKGRSPGMAVLGIPLFVLLVVPVSLVLLLVQAVYQRMGLTFESQPLITQLIQTDATWFVVVLSICAVIVGPVIEEMFFRGILYPTLREKWGIAPAVLVSSAIFAIMHFHLPTMLPLFVLAVMLCLAFEYTGSLTVCVIAHALFNSLSIIMIWLLRGLR